MSKAQFEIVETFEITDRGVVVVIDEITERGVGKPHKVRVLTPEGHVIEAEAYKERLLRRNPTPVEKEAYLLKGLHKSSVPSGSQLRFVE